MDRTPVNTRKIKKVFKKGKVGTDGSVSGKSRAALAQEQKRILGAFGTFTIDPDYDYKAERDRKRI
jgi:hypothetical protein